MGSYPKTAFQKIAFFNTLIGNHNAATIEGLKAQFSCIKEEFEELEIALKQMEALELEPQRLNGAEITWQSEYDAAFQEMRDGIADVLVTVYGLAHRAGIDADRDLEIVNISNMSKFIKHDALAYTEDEFLRLLADEQITIATVKNLSTCVAETAPGIFAITSSKDQTGTDGKFYPAGKLLKPSTYKEPDWSSDPTLFMRVNAAEILNNLSYGITFDEAKAIATDDFCDKAPEGWICTREHGHEGPCAARNPDENTFGVIDDNGTIRVEFKDANILENPFMQPVGVIEALNRRIDGLSVQIAGLESQVTIIAGKV